MPWLKHSRNLRILKLNWESVINSALSFCSVFLMICWIPCKVAWRMKYTFSTHEALWIFVKKYPSALLQNLFLLCTPSFPNLHFLCHLPNSDLNLSLLKILPCLTNWSPCLQCHTVHTHISCLPYQWMSRLSSWSPNFLIVMWANNSTYLRGLWCGLKATKGTSLELPSECQCMIIMLSVVNTSKEERRKEKEGESEGARD